MAFVSVQPGLNVQQPQLATQMPLRGQVVGQPQIIPTNSIKYNQAAQFAPIQTTTVQTTQPTFVNAQPMIAQSTIPTVLSPSRRVVNTVNAVNTVNTVQQPIVAAPPMQTQIIGSQVPVTSQVITTGAGCPPPVLGQPIVIEGVAVGTQSYIDPVKQTVLLQGAQVRPELSQVMKGESRFEYVPYEQVVTEYDQLEKKIRIPINKYITEYQVIDHQIEYIPEVTYQTQTDYLPTQRVEEEVQYSTQEKRIEHGIKQEMRTSQIIEGGAIATTTIAQPTTKIVQQTLPTQTISAVPVSTQFQQVKQVSPIVQSSVQPIVRNQIVQGGIINQAPMMTQTQTVAQQWPTTWNSGMQQGIVKKKSSSSS